MKNKIWNAIKEVYIGLCMAIGTLVIIILMVFAIVMIAINPKSDDPKETEFIDLQIITMNGNGTVYYDKNTGVMYYRLGDASFPILNQDGTPKIYSGDE